jgi:hypothetical protein
MQKSFVAKTQIYFQAAEFYVRAGDILVHDPANANKLTIFRNKEIVKITTEKGSALDSMAKANASRPAWLDEIVTDLPVIEQAAADVVEIVKEVIPPTPAPVAPVVAPPVPTPAPTPAPVVESQLPVVTPPVVAPVAPVVEAPKAEAPKVEEKKAEEAPKTVDLTALTKNQIVDHAKEVHGLELDVNLKKDDLIKAVEEKKAV